MRALFTSGSEAAAGAAAPPAGVSTPARQRKPRHSSQSPHAHRGGRERVSVMRGAARGAHPKRAGSVEARRALRVGLRPRHRYFRRRYAAAASARAPSAMTPPAALACDAQSACLEARFCATGEERVRRGSAWRGANVSAVPTSERKRARAERQAGRAFASASLAACRSCTSPVLARTTRARRCAAGRGSSDVRTRAPHHNCHSRSRGANAMISGQPGCVAAPHARSVTPTCVCRRGALLSRHRAAAALRVPAHRCSSASRLAQRRGRRAAGGERRGERRQRGALLRRAHRAHRERGS